MRHIRRGDSPHAERRVGQHRHARRRHLRRRLPVARPPRGRHRRLLRQGDDEARGEAVARADVPRALPARAAASLRGGLLAGCALRPHLAAWTERGVAHPRRRPLCRAPRRLGEHVRKLRGARRRALAAADGVQQHRPRVHPLGAAGGAAPHCLRRLLHPRPPLHHRDHLLRRPLLLWRPRAAPLSEARRLRRRHRRAAARLCARRLAHASAADPADPADRERAGCRDRCGRDADRLACDGGGAGGATGDVGSRGASRAASRCAAARAQCGGRRKD
mmetsp:Transcript_42489/g.133321  ORF Transcript_42489/g.133321 Transcript_42489/m.133321 type:complete len:276 (+) Transcript_42489:91-918(+)